MGEKNGSGVGPTDHQVLTGGQEIDVKYRDGQSEKVKVSVPNIRRMAMWEDLQVDEASLVEFYCGKLDEDNLYAIRRLLRERASLVELQSKTQTLKERLEVDAEISKIDVKINELQKGDRWDDKLEPESHAAIYQLGQKLTRPFYEQWGKNTREATALFREKLKALTVLTPKEEKSASATSSPSAAPS